MKNTSKNLIAKLALLGASIIWGSSFLIVKTSVDMISPNTLLGIRFTIACLLLGFIFFKRLKNINKEYFLGGGLLGTFLFIAYSIQTIGITDTTPGKNAFLTAIYCVLVPFIYWIVDKKRPDIYNFSAGILAITGIGLVSLDQIFNIRMGDTLSLISGIFYAIHMVAVARIQKDKDPVLITIIQFAFAAVFSWITAFIFEDMPSVWNQSLILGLLYLSIFCTAVALLLQNIGQKYTKPAQASIILSLESVFGVIFSVMLYHEEINIKLMIGFLFIFIAILISEIKPSFFTSFRKAKEVEL
ncbi:MAG TPA: DMT family transporter [Clostridiales bacterium]|jgi:drug/metabolite transporter (DMT)-like permease|nr:DMT family transporter [Clostridiales bacterium]